MSRDAITRAFVYGLVDPATKRIRWIDARTNAINDAGADGILAADRLAARAKGDAVSTTQCRHFVAVISR